MTEIGVHHGKLSILLALLGGARLVAYDLFSRQDENVDGSGRGNLAVFQQNCRKHCPAIDVLPVEVNSLDLTAERIRQDCGTAPVFFSVDGGHTVEATLNDLRVAGEAVAEDGVVILDDFYNEAFPEVAFGTMRYLAEAPGQLHLFCIVGNKLLFARDPEIADRLATMLAQIDPAAIPRVHTVEMCEIMGRSVCTMRQADRLTAMLRRMLRNPRIRALERSRLGQMLGRCYRRVLYG